MRRISCFCEKYAADHLVTICASLSDDTVDRKSYFEAKERLAEIGAAPRFPERIEPNRILCELALPAERYERALAVLQEYPPHIPSKEELDALLEQKAGRVPRMELSMSVLAQFNINGFPPDFAYGTQGRYHSEIFIPCVEFGPPHTAHLKLLFPPQFNIFTEEAKAAISEMERMLGITFGKKKWFAETMDFRTGKWKCRRVVYE